MSPDKNDLAFALDCWAAVCEINLLLTDVEATDFRQNRLILLAVERLVLIAGEAAARLSPEFCREHSGVPWREMIRLRNLVAHNYGPQVIPEVWGAARRLLPLAQTQLECIIPSSLRQGGG